MTWLKSLAFQLMQSEKMVGLGGCNTAALACVHDRESLAPRRIVPERTKQMAASYGWLTIAKVDTVPFNAQNAWSGLELAFRLRSLLQLSTIEPRCHSRPGQWRQSA